MEVAKLSALPNLKVRSVSCNESAIKRWLSSELEETVFPLTHELFMTKHHTVTLRSLTTSNQLQLAHTLYIKCKTCVPKLENYSSIIFARDISTVHFNYTSLVQTEIRAQLCNLYTNY